MSNYSAIRQPQEPRVVVCEAVVDGAYCLRRAEKIVASRSATYQFCPLHARTLATSGQTR